MMSRRSGGVLFACLLTVCSACVVQATNNIPHVQNFESIPAGDDIGDPGTNGWTANTGVITNQTSIVNGGVRAASIFEGAATNSFTNTTATNTWIEFYTRPQFREFDPTNHPSIEAGTEAAFYVNTNGYITAYDGDAGQWMILSNTAVGGPLTPLSTATWVRITLAMNYSSNLWSIFVNNKLHGDELGFYSDSSTYFNRMTVSDSNSVAYLDDLTVDANTATNNPSGGVALTDDSDFDNMTDWFEIFYFQTIDVGFDEDPDGDEFSNLDEFLAGTNPLDPSSAPASSTNYALPYFEPFEELTNGNLHAQHGWSVSNTTYAKVQTTNTWEGSKAGGLTNTTASVTITDSTATQVWTSVRCVAGNIGNPDATGITNGASALYFVNADGIITAWSNGSWVAISNDIHGAAIPTIGTNDWIRLVSYTDYGSTNWSLFYSDQTTNQLLTTVATGLPFADTSLTVYTGFAVTNGGSAWRDFDDVQITKTRPDDVDMDNDGMGDNYEDNFLTNIVGGLPNSDHDGDGMSNIEEFIAGTDPTDAGSYLQITAAGVPYPHVDVTFRSGTNRTFTLWQQATYTGAKSVLAYMTNAIWGTTNMTSRDSNVGTTSGLDLRFYSLSVTRGSQNYTSDVVYIMRKELRQANNWYLTSVPVDFGANNNLNSDLGTVLARGLLGNATDTSADQVYVVNTNDGSLNTGYYLDQSNTWRNLSDGQPANASVDPMQGMMVKTAVGSPASTNSLLTGPVYTNSINKGIRASGKWHLIAWPFPNSRTITDAWDGTGFGLANAGADNGASWQSGGDRLLLPDSSGRRYSLYLNTNDVWRIKDTRTDATDFTIEPGQVFHLYHNGSGYIWTPDWTP